MFDDKEYYLFKKRGIILIEGKDRFKFIQGIISNDIELLRKKPSIYSSLLTPQGKFQYDFFISNFKEKLYLECDISAQEELISKFMMFKLRLDVKVSINSDYNIILSKKKLNFSESNSSSIFSFYDPRFDNSFFSRTYADSNFLTEIKKKYVEINENRYQTLRLNNCIPDFSIDATKAKSLLLEMRFDELNGISWTKGCYMGQEITARMKHRNIVKKKIFKVLIDFRSNLKNEITLENETVGKLTSHNKKNGIAFLDTKVLSNLNTKKFFSGDSKIIIQEPWWV
ncbi:hypothetical protein OAY92_01925 [Alphaproteobacteria bacterium]|nr:hypothetical protein [Alphaproteobacteria bacterium]